MVVIVALVVQAYLLLPPPSSFHSSQHSLACPHLLLFLTYTDNPPKATTMKRNAHATLRDVIIAQQNNDLQRMEAEQMMRGEKAYMEGKGTCRLRRRRRRRRKGRD